MTSQVMPFTISELPYSCCLPSTLHHYKCGIDPLSSENSTTALSAGYIVHGSIRKSAMRQPAFCFASCANAASIFSANTMAIASR